jgi:hypothetical protein
VSPVDLAVECTARSVTLTALIVFLLTQLTPAQPGAVNRHEHGGMKEILSPADQAPHLHAAIR